MILTRIQTTPPPPYLIFVAIAIAVQYRISISVRKNLKPESHAISFAEYLKLSHPTAFHVDILYCKRPYGLI